MLCLHITGSRKHKEFTPLVERNLGNQVRSVAEPVNAEPPRVAGFAIGTVTNQPSAKQRRDRNVIVFLRQMETVSRIRDGELGVTADDGITGKAGVIAKI